MELVERLLAGDVRAVARIISLVENEAPEARNIMSLLHKHTGNTHVVGITGLPGSGKSTLTDKLTAEYRKHDKSVGIIAVDPTSPFTGGALLGDRIRMQRHSTDRAVFIRSMGTRGCLGGVASTTHEVIKVLDAFGKDIIFVETVGVGQGEVDIVKSAHTSIVVEMPGLGDEIQAIKAGILEIGDIYVVNKADLDGAESAVNALRMMLETNPHKTEWAPPIIKTIAKDGKGNVELVQAIAAHMKHLRATDQFYSMLKAKTELEFIELVRRNLTDYIWRKAIDKGELDELIEKIIAKQIDPYSAVDKILDKVLS